MTKPFHKLLNLRHKVLREDSNDNKELVSRILALARVVAKYVGQFVSDILEFHQISLHLIESPTNSGASQLWVEFRG